MFQIARLNASLKGGCGNARYYFDIREGDDLAPDDEGLELPSIERVQEEAARSLAWHGAG